MAKYLKRDSDKGFVEDYVEIQSLKFNNARHTVLGNMMGDYDEQGYYRVNPEIVKELIEMPKYVVEVLDNLEICLSTLKLDKQISFLVAYEGEKATLSLLEKISFESNNKLDAGTWSNVNEYILDVVETNGIVDRQALYLKWNIQTFPGMIIDIFNCDESVIAKYFNIITRFKYNLQARTILLEKENEIEDIEAEYFIDLFNVLNGYPKFKKAIEKQLKQTLTEKKDFVKLDKPNFVKTLNEIVNKALEDNAGILTENEQQMFNTEKRNITVKLNIKKYDSITLNTENVEITQDHQEIPVKLEIEPNANVFKFDTEDVRFKSSQEVAQLFAKIDKQVTNNAEKNAFSILSGENKGRVSQVVNIILKSGVELKMIASPSILTALAEKRAKEIVKEKVVENNKQPYAESKSEKKDNNKKEEKKDKKKEVNKEKKKAGSNQEKKKETKSTEKQKKSEGFVGVGYVAEVQNSEEKVEKDVVDVSNKVLDAEKQLKNQKKSGLIGQYVEEDKKRNNLIVAASALELEEQKEKNAAHKNSNPVTPNLTAKANDVKVKTTTSRVSVRTLIKSTDKDFGL